MSSAHQRREHPDTSDPQALPETAERLRVARVGKPHGVRGEVTVQLFTDEPTVRLAPGAVLIRTPGRDTPDRTTASLTVSGQRWNKSICLLTFAGIGDRDAAEALRGSFLHVEVPAEPEDEDGWYSHQIAGFRCVGAQEQDLGTAREIITGAAQDLLSVETPSGEEVLVPFVEELVPGIDVEARTIRLDPPVGLF
ncbi:ribosome maturation factor RimM [Nesterenkonia sp. HG001]|uniref:ribosome maturation factor RimM n=1 Tax=Nesterenkonia sp. HG001 TaxID=2983207 RepID=UPI002AC6A90F|nr:ribosome maturation factor RimM [Nesterenkonia sp. HG001]MDZ5078532.1 ribosome maturation factor RimM [Nesterenkonia sp. HG001]